MKIPIKLYNKLDEKFGPFTLKPCSLKNGLKQDWVGEFCFISLDTNIKIWLEKALKEIHKSNNKNTKSFFLIPAKTEKEWFHEIILPNVKEIYFLKGQSLQAFILEKKTPGIQHKVEIKSFIIDK